HGVGRHRWRRGGVQRTPPSEAGGLDLQRRGFGQMAGRAPRRTPGAPAPGRLREVAKEKLDKKLYKAELERLQIELVKLQQWVREEKERVLVVFEGRDAAGKGGVIKRITDHLSPRTVRVAALPAPDDKEKTQWYFQRYIANLPFGGEVVLFDRSWYNRAGV